MRNAAVYQFEQALPFVVQDVGLLTDELEDPLTGASADVLSTFTGVKNSLDERILPEGVSEDGDSRYKDLQQFRGFANQALGALVTYDTLAKDSTTSKVLRGELYAFEGYAELWLADLFCSGVPLSTLDFQGDFTYAAGSTTAQVYQDARAKFDTALILGRASDSVVYLAQVGEGRANLDLGRYAAAADDVANVPDAFQYQVAFPDGQLALSNPNINQNQAVATVSNNEGINGLPYRSNGMTDPRTATVTAGVNSISGDSLYFPAKYKAALTGNGYAPFTLASGVEARLIQAEAQLQPASAPAGPWLATLNALRINALTNSHGLIPALSTLADPGATLTGDAAATARISLLFRERAYWLFVDGHRQGDLRRLLRQYGIGQRIAAFNDQSKVYPTGPYLGPGTGEYGTDVTVPIPSSEDPNPLFTGCKDRNP